MQYFLNTQKTGFGKEIPSFFRRKCIMYPMKDLRRLHTRYVTNCVYPHLAETLGDFETWDTYRHCYDLEAYRNRVGRAVIIGYEYSLDDDEMHFLFDIAFEKAPLVLSPRCSHYVQMCSQVSSCLPYNESLKFVFVCVLLSPPIVDPQENGGPPMTANMSLVYAYETGIGRTEYEAFVRCSTTCISDAQPEFRDAFERTNVKPFEFKGPDVPLGVHV